MLSTVLVFAAGCMLGALAHYWYVRRESRKFALKYAESLNQLGAQMVALSKAQKDVSSVQEFIDEADVHTTLAVRDDSDQS